MIAPHLTDPDPTITPLLKCVGGKRKLVPELLKRLPKLGPSAAYFEPFVGGGALFFALQPKKAYLGDANEQLMNVYTVLRDDVEGLIRELKKKRYANTSEAYYKVRETIFTGTALRNAAEFCYVNRTAFNGVFRTNKSGVFNVPFGKYTNPTICNEDNFRACSRALRNVHFSIGDFTTTMKSARKGDVAYFDPPYWPVSKTANFTSYTSDGFDANDQVRLRDEAMRLKTLGVFVLLSNADAPPVRALYKGFRMDRVQMARAINSDGEGRGKVGELLIY